MEGREPAVGEFFCQKAIINYVYSFGLMEISATDGERVGQEQGRYVVNFEGTLVPRIKKMADESGFAGWSRGKPIHRTGMTPHLRFCNKVTQEVAYLEFHSRHGQLITSEGKVLRLTVDRLFRFWSPASTFSLALIAEPEDPKHLLHANDILELLSLVQLRERESIRKFKFDGGEEHSIYGLFKSAVEQLCTCDPQDTRRLCWLEDKLKLIDSDKEAQIPWVITVLEVDGKIAEAFCGTFCDAEDGAKAKAAAIAPYREQIAPILFRAPGADVKQSLQLEPAYLRTLEPRPTDQNGSMQSLGVDARVFVQVSRRSVLCICRDRALNPADFLLPDLLDTCEMVRVRWHMLIVMNQVLDLTLRELRDTEQTQAGLREGMEVQRIMRLREWLSTSLEDPGIYTITGEFLSRLNDRMGVALRIREVRELVSGKLNLFERIFRDVQEHEWLESRARRRPQNPSNMPTAS